MNALNKDLSGQNFDGQDLSYALLRGANLSGCSFVGTNLTGANIVDANIDGANFTDATMHYCNLSNATGSGNFTNAKMKGAPKVITMTGADWTAEPPFNINSLPLVILVAIEQTGVNDIVIPETLQQQIEDGELDANHGIADLDTIMPHGNMFYNENGMGDTEIPLWEVINFIVQNELEINTNGDYYVKTNN